MFPADQLRLTRAQWAAVTAHLTAERPNEACGLLAGLAGQARAVYPVRNRLASPTAFEMEPAELIAALIAIEAAGLELTAIYHSHPAGPPRPSATDVAQAYYPEALALICAPDPAGGWHGRAFQIVAGAVREVPLEINP